MKKILLHALLLTLAHTSFAQLHEPLTIPSPQSATLKEWWHADNMGYGIDGMTWLENFYNGQGALVISTPHGVKTWQLRYAWDTVNVFTWAGGDANIKSGDVNGDGILDYVDGLGNIYIGTANGQPPNALPSKMVNQAGPYMLADIDGDGKQDLIDFVTNAPVANIAFGQDSMKNMQRRSYAIVGIDTAHHFLHAYKLANGDLRVVLLHVTYWYHTKFPYQQVISNGLRLVGLHWDKDAGKIQASIIQDTSWQTNDSNNVYLCSQLSFAKSSPRLLLATFFSANLWKSNFTTFDISQDRFRVVSSYRLDSIRSIVPLRYSLDSNNTPSLCIIRSDRWHQDIYHGITDSSLEELADMSKFAPADRVIDVPKSPTRSSSCLVIAGGYLYNGDDASAISFSSLVDTVSEIGFTPQANELQLSVKPSPANGDQLIVHVEAKVAGSYSVELCDLMGRHVCTLMTLQIEAGAQNLALPLQCAALSSGIYFITLRGVDRSARCAFVIE